MATQKVKKVVKKKRIEEVPADDTITTVNRSTLAKALKVSGKAISPNPALPLLGNILLECANGESAIAATDLKIGVRYTLPMKGVSFRTCVPAKTFQGLIDTLNVNEIEMSLQPAEQNMVIVAENNVSSLKCIDPEDFPPISRVDNPQVIIPVEEFKQMVNRVAFASSGKDEGRIIEGVLLAVEEVDEQSRFIMFAADGQRAAYEETESATIMGEEFKAIVTGTTLETIASILPDQGLLEIEARDTKVLFHCEEVDVITQVLNGMFPDYHLIGKSVEERSTTVTLSTLELLRACKQLKVFAQDTGMSKMEIQDFIIKYATARQEKGDTDITLFGSKEGEDLLIGLNVYYLYEFLEVVKTPEVVLSFRGDKKPILLKMNGVENYYHIIMPFSLG